MARLRPLVLLVATTACATSNGSNTCYLLESPPRVSIKTVVYVHSIGPDYLTAYGYGCESSRSELLETSNLNSGEGILHIINRSEAGYSVPYDAMVWYDRAKNAVAVSLIGRNKSYREIKFRGVDPPK